MRCRKFDLETDYPTVVEWWTSYNHGLIAKAILPVTGVAIENESGEMIAASWLYFTNARCAIIDWTVVSPTAGLMDRGRAIRMAFQYLEALASSTDVAVIFGFSGYRGFTKTMLRLGYQNQGRQCDVMAKAIKGDF